ncbi:MAG: VIT1/CCC1 transporter family protein [Anaerolineae bacterium]
MQRIIDERRQVHHRGATEAWHSRGGAYLGDIIFGANDGIVTTFALVAGVEGAALSSHAILVVGLAKLLADAVSMGLGNYLAIRSQVDFYNSELAREWWEVKHLADVERQEIRDIYAEKGFEGEDLERAVQIITSDEERWVDVMMKEELGLIEEGSGSPSKSGFLTGMAFILIGALPLLPYMLGMAGSSALWFSAALTLACLFAVGASRAIVTARIWIWSGLEMLGIGSAAALVAYLVGSLIGG